MFETAERLTLAGIGALAVITEKADNMIRELAGKGEAKREEARHLFRELAAKGEQKKAEFLCRLCQKTNLKEALSLVTREEFEELKERIARLEEQLSKE
jgi:polyhydroxyalkanoate synthesis regulator phasin